MDNEQNRKPVRNPQDKVAIFGKSNSFKVEIESGPTGIDGIGIDAASSIDGRFDWTNKIRLKLNMDEVVIMACVCRGLIAGHTFNNHGARHNKALELVNQGRTLLIRVFDPSASKDAGGRAAGGLKLAPITPERDLYLSALCTRAIVLATGLDATGVSVLLKEYAHRASKTKRHQVKQGQPEAVVPHVSPASVTDQQEFKKNSGHKKARRTFLRPGLQSFLND